MTKPKEKRTIEEDRELLKLVLNPEIQVFCSIVGTLGEDWEKEVLIIDGNQEHRMPLEDLLAAQERVLRAEFEQKLAEAFKDGKRFEELRFNVVNSQLTTDEWDDYDQLKKKYLSENKDE